MICLHFASDCEDRFWVAPDSIAYCYETTNSDKGRFTVLGIKSGETWHVAETPETIMRLVRAATGK